MKNYATLFLSVFALGSVSVALYYGVECNQMEQTIGLLEQRIFWLNMHVRVRTRQVTVNGAAKGENHDTVAASLNDPHRILPDHLREINDRAMHALSDPALRPLLREALRANVVQQYSEFLKDSNWTPEKKIRFTEVMLDQKLGTADAVTVGISEGVSPESLPMLAEVASPGAEMQELLGPSDSDKLKDYNITLGSRQTVNMISQSVVGQGLLLTQAERDVVSNAVTQFPGSRPGDADLADSTQSLARREANDDAIVKAVSKSLSPASTSAIKLALASETAKVKLGSALMDRTAPDKQ